MNDASPRVKVPESGAGGFEVGDGAAGGGATGDGGDSEASSAKLACVKATVTLSKVVLSTSAREVPDVSMRIAVAEPPS